LKKLAETRTRYEAAKREASIQLELTIARYKNVAQFDKDLTFESWLGTHGFDYTDAVEDRADAKKELRERMSLASNDVRRCREQIAAARDANTHHPGFGWPWKRVVYTR